MLATEPTVRRWSLEEYYRMGEMGFFADERVELIDGEIIEMAPQKDVHAMAVSAAYEAFIRSAPEGVWVRSQLPLHLSETSEPEPDLSIVAGHRRTYVGKGHPNTALLVIEISESSLAFDRQTKGSLYASAGINDFWIVDLKGRCVEVYRSPVVDASARFGYRYGEKAVFRGEQRIKPLGLSGDVAVGDLLP